MVDAAEKILRFEALRLSLAAREAPRTFEALATGSPAIDEAVGGLGKGLLNEFCGSTGSGFLLVDVLLHEAERSGWHLALVDASDAFDPSDYPAALLRRMLWIRCRDVRQAIRSTDLLLHDGNLPLIVLDLQGVGDSALRRIAANTWHRYARILEESGTSLLVLSRRPTAEGAKLRIHSETHWPLEALEEPRDALKTRLRLVVKERAGAAIRRRSA